VIGKQDLDGNEIREGFLRFFRARHRRVRICRWCTWGRYPAVLTNAGMNQF